MKNESNPVPQSSEDWWSEFRGLTDARIGLKRAGASLATAPQLEFQLAHARARDAVHEPLDAERLVLELEKTGLPVLHCFSAATNRQQYLMRPDLGRQLDPESIRLLEQHRAEHDVAIVIADGLSARAVQTHTAPVLSEAIPALRENNWRIAPLVVVSQGRVAIGDAVANILNTKCVTLLIGERPGLSAPDSMGAYLTWQPDSSTTDAGRNCISNIRPGGIGYTDAAFKLVHLLRVMRAGGISGVQLKDDSDRLLIGPAGGGGS